MASGERRNESFRYGNEWYSTATDGKNRTVDNRISQEFGFFIYTDLSSK